VVNIPSGRWYAFKERTWLTRTFATLLDDPSSPLETSATAGIAYGILRAIDAGILDKDDRAYAERALAAVLAQIDEEG
ncbi:glycoside hydrolase family 88 protein, partial [Rhizobium leguminosarum]|uniref:glycoside hydrolase family 88 protein n=1 Tax=Rhizobium leguminosarum TaxID=384 RepID=UPI003F986679